MVQCIGSYGRAGRNRNTINGPGSCCNTLKISNEVIVDLRSAGILCSGDRNSINSR